MAPLGGTRNLLPNLHRSNAVSGARYVGCNCYAGGAHDPQEWPARVAQQSDANAALGQPRDVPQGGRRATARERRQTRCGSM
eukprot:8949310-Alexandrium_andersonii.AAC.1